MHLFFMTLEKKGFKKFLKYVKNFQLSVIRGEITPSKLIQLRNELKKVIDTENDFICIIKLKNDNIFGEEILGNVKENKGEILII